MNLKYTFALLFLVSFFSLDAQIRYGFKTGLNFARFSGPSEINDAGADLETWSSVTGFHIGATFAYHFAEHYSVRAELMYSKKGAKYIFDGQSYRIFDEDGPKVMSTGLSRYLININNSYVDIPLLGVGRWGDFEFSAGGYVALLIGSVGDGSLRYNGKTAPPQNFQIVDKQTSSQELVFNLSHNYRKDDPGVGDTDIPQEVTANLGTRDENIPKTLGAYYDYAEDKGNLYKGVDYGLVGGFAYYISGQLYIGLRLQYGLADITNNAADLSKARVNEDGSLIFRDDKDKNFSIQATVGFSF